MTGVLIGDWIFTSTGTLFLLDPVIQRFSYSQGAGFMSLRDLAGVMSLRDYLVKLITGEFMVEERTDFPRIPAFGESTSMRVW